MLGSPSESWHGIPRERIHWRPSVVAERCEGCGLCVTSCGRGVYAFDYEGNLPVVVAPLRCMVGCTSCATICLRDAIEFPSRGAIRAVIREYRLLRRAKDTLREEADRYDVRTRPPLAR